jgi:hypothetical protein
MTTTSSVKKEMTLTEAKSILLNKVNGAAEEKKTVTINLNPSQNVPSRPIPPPNQHEPSPVELPVRDHPYVSSHRGQYSIQSETFVVEKEGEPDRADNSSAFTRLGLTLSPIRSFSPSNTAPTSRRSLPPEPTDRGVLNALEAHKTTAEEITVTRKSASRWGANSPVCSVIPLAEERSASPILNTSGEVERLQQKAQELHQQWRQQISAASSSSYSCAMNTTYTTSKVNGGPAQGSPSAKPSSSYGEPGGEIVLEKPVAEKPSIVIEKDVSVIETPTQIKQEPISIKEEPVLVLEEAAPPVETIAAATSTHESSEY